VHDHDHSSGSAVVARSVNSVGRRFRSEIQRACLQRFPPEREALQALITETQRDVSGLVRLKLYKGNMIVAGRKSPKSLYDPKIATMEGEVSGYDQSNATGFIRLNTLRLKLRILLDQYQ
jgi:argininosuccinate synthase